MSGGVVVLNENPAEYKKLKDNHALIPGMVSEIIRWQTPLSHMRRTATRDTELGGKQIKKGEKLIMWYISGNRDSEVIDRADEFIIDRANPRHHVSFGFGIHRCMGNRLAEMQLRIVWEEIMKRFEKVELVGEPVRVMSNFIKGFTEVPVKLTARS
jgi:cytochrome P450